MDEAGEAEGSGLRVAFDRRLKLEFHGATVTSDAGLLAFRELDDALGLTALAAEVLADPRTGRNGRHSLIAQLRQSVFGRLAGYEDVNDADRLGRDPAMRWIVGGRAVTDQAASTVVKVEWHPGELLPRVGFIVTNLHRQAKRVVAFYNGRGDRRAVDQGGQARGQVDAAVVHDLPRERRPAPAPRLGVQPRQLPPHPGSAGRGRAVVADEPAREGGEDRGEGDRPWPLRD